MASLEATIYVVQVGGSISRAVAGRRRLVEATLSRSIPVVYSHVLTGDPVDARRERRVLTPLPMRVDPNQLVRIG